ncbi:MAG: hypothetical protein GY696_03330 [Gammaproteobacteria bacterium]|nr:hypothetical protein [Gammaproteobacteria bacterium]
MKISYVISGILLLTSSSQGQYALASPTVLAKNEQISFAFATWMGTGAYRVSNRSVAVLNLPIYYPLREATPEQWGVEIKLPVALGSYRYEDLPIDLQTVTFVPGMELDIPVSDTWRIKPYAQLGMGKDFSDGRENALIFGAGLKALGAYPFRDFDLVIGGGLLLAGSNLVSEDETNGFSKVDLGLNGRFPVDFTVWSEPAVIDIFFVASRIINKATLPLIEDDEDQLKNMFELGFSLGSQPAAKIGQFNIPKMGISYIFGDHLKGIKFNFGFPF